MVGLIYVIQSKQTELVYVGSTIQPLKRRFSSHKTEYKHWLRDGRRCCSSKSLLIFKDTWIEEIDRIEIEDSKHRGELKRLEMYWINQFGELCVNRQAAFTGKTRDEQWRDWYAANMEHHLQQLRKWRAANMEHYAQQAREWRASQPRIQCECGGSYKRYRRVGHILTQGHQKYKESLQPINING